MSIIKVSSPTDYVKLYEYLKGIDEVILADLGSFIMMCETGRSYVIQKDDEIIGALCMYETAKMVFVAHMHIDIGYRKTMLSLGLYDLIVKYSRDKSKKAYTTMDDISQVEKFLIPADVLDSGDILYRIDTNRSTDI